jgi:DNA-binding transcriptional ArsR family regulator
VDAFTAVADPTRRRIVEMLGDGALDAGTIGSTFDVSQPAISRHLRTLRLAGVVAVREEGRRRVYRLERAGLDELTAWVDRQRSFWEGKLDALADLAEERS